MWLLIWERWSEKNRIEFEGQVTYREGKVTKITEWIGNAKNIPEWWTNLLQWKQMLAIKHRINVCVS